MPIIINIDVMLARRKMSSGELAEKVGITPANLSILKCGKANRKRPRPDKPSESREGSAETLRGLSFCLKMCKFAHSNK